MSLTMVNTISSPLTEEEEEEEEEPQVLTQKKPKKEKKVKEEKKVKRDNKRATPGDIGDDLDLNARDIQAIKLKIIVNMRNIGAFLVRGFSYDVYD